VATATTATVFAAAAAERARLDYRRDRRGAASHCVVVAAANRRGGRGDDPAWPLPTAMARFWRKVRYQQLSAGQLYATLLVVAVVAAFAAHFIMQVRYWLAPEPSPWLLPTLHGWGRKSRPRWRALQSIWRDVGGSDLWLLFAAVGVCALVSAGRAGRAGGPFATVWERGQKSRARRRSTVSQRDAGAIGMVTRGMTPAEVADAKAREALERIRRDIRRGEELFAVLALEGWADGRDGQRPLQRVDLQMLLEDTARAGGRHEVLRVVATQLEKSGVPLDWAAAHDCSGNMGRYALDAALDAAINESQDQIGALLMLDLGLRSGSGSVERLNAGPFLRSAATHGMLRFAERLIHDAGADVNSRDPRYGRTPLDCALESGQEAVALRLLDLGALAPSGASADSLLGRATPRVRARIMQRLSDGVVSVPPSSSSVAPVAESMASVLEVIRAHLRRGDADAAVAALDAADVQSEAQFSVAERQVLLEECVRHLGGGRHRRAANIVRRLASDMETSGTRLDWPAGGNVSAGFGRFPLDAALDAAIREAGDEKLGLLLLDLGLASGTGSVERLAAGPLLRAAAARDMSELVGRLVEDCGADPNVADPQFGGVALDRAVAAGEASPTCWRTPRRAFARRSVTTFERACGIFQTR